MYEKEKYYSSLELPAVLSLLAEQATIDTVKEAALKLRPYDDVDTVREELAKTDEAYLLSAKYAVPSFGNPLNPDGMLVRAEVGATLTMSELLSLANTLRVIRTVKEWRNNISDMAVEKLEELFSLLQPNKYLEDMINSSIKNNEEMYDNASSQLADIRRKISAETQTIKSKLDAIVKNHNKAKFLQEAIVTQRDGRYVVPVKAEFKSEISGIVHDTSSTGATLFVEPMGVVESNNEIRVLMSAERDEIERILMLLSVKASEFADGIRLSYDALCMLNLIFAKANLAYKMHATMPKINTDGHILLKEAKHPLIPKQSVVPISVELGNAYDTLVITGPNTGGKTVTLKTVGLLTLMAMCGLMIPAGDGSEVSFFDRILVDIGDEQSIEQSLSTFSSHMVNLIRILEEAASFKSLVLLDEVGGGTDPIEGAALAKAILVKLSQCSAKTIATTHYIELKSYALNTPHVENASCEFNVKTLMPTYKLLIGVPGKSNAFTIARKLGIPADVVALADSYVSDDDRNIDRITEALEIARQDAEKERKKAIELKNKADKLMLETEELKRNTEMRQNALLEKAQNDAAFIIDDARRKSDMLIGELADIKRKFNAENAAELYGVAKRTEKRIIDDMEKTSNPVVKKDNSDYTLPRTPVVGDAVTIIDLGKEAVIEQASKDNKRFFVAVGGLKTWVDIKNIRLIEKKDKPQQASKGRKITGVKSKVERDVRYEFDMRGMTVDEGIMELDRYIDGAVLAGIPSVTVIHGKGTGALRKAVHEFLKSNRNIISFRLGVFGEGESGVTIAEIKS